MTPMGSTILDDILKQERSRLAMKQELEKRINPINEAKQERVELPPALNDFLNSIQREDKPPEKR